MFFSLNFRYQGQNQQFSKCSVLFSCWKVMGSCHFPLWATRILPALSEWWRSGLYVTRDMWQLLSAVAKHIDMEHTPCIDHFLGLSVFFYMLEGTQTSAIIPFFWSNSPRSNRASGLRSAACGKTAAWNGHGMVTDFSGRYICCR